MSAEWEIKMLEELRRIYNIQFRIRFNHAATEKLLEGKHEP